MWIWFVSLVANPVFKNGNSKKKIVRHSALCCPNLRLPAFHHCHREETGSNHTGTNVDFILIAPLIQIDNIRKNWQPSLFTFWMECSGTAGLNDSTVATRFTHDFPTRAVFIPVSWSHRFDAWNTKNPRQRQTSAQFVCFFFRLTNTLKMAGARNPVGLAWKKRWDHFYFPANLHRKFRPLTCVYLLLQHLTRLNRITRQKHESSHYSQSIHPRGGEIMTGLAHDHRPKWLMLLFGAQLPSPNYCLHAGALYAANIQRSVAALFCQIKAWFISMFAYLLGLHDDAPN